MGGQLTAAASVCILLLLMEGESRTTHHRAVSSLYPSARLTVFCRRGEVEEAWPPAPGEPLVGVLWGWTRAKRQFINPFTTNRRPRGPLSPFGRTCHACELAMQNGYRYKAPARLRWWRREGEVRLGGGLKASIPCISHIFFYI